MGELRAQFDRWERQEIDSFELNETVHRFHQGASRDIWKRYDTSHLEPAIASAVVAGVIRREELPSELLQHIAGLIEFYRGGSLGGTSHLIEIREEQPADIDAVRQLNRQAFDQEQEGRIVDALRDAGAITLALVAISEGVVVGHIVFSPVNVAGEVGAALGPMAVSPSFQRQGIGSRLVAQGLERLRGRKCPFVVVIGHPEFYPRFGFAPAGPLGLTCEWEVPAEAFMVNVLRPEVSPRLRGHALYRSEFSAIE